MTDYLSFQFNDTPEFISTFDEQPLWSAHFGILMLKHIELKPNITLLDLGSGAGFPLLELAERLGSSSKCYGLDPWTNANSRDRQKLRDYNIGNVEIIDGSATQIPFDDKSIDLIISNLGVNNFDDAQAALKECRRVLKPGGRLVITTNLNGHWKEFYDTFQRTLAELDEPELVQDLISQQEHRGSIASIAKRLEDCGLKMTRHFEDKFQMRFLDGSAFLRHHFVKVGWLGSWRDLVPEEKRVKIFQKLEENLNSYAAENGGLALTVPMAYVEAG
jgi:ubiquinone/menaquinone biosynthesis C-methylase UbiE